VIEGKPEPLNQISLERELLSHTALIFSTGKITSSLVMPHFI
jgi:hypothetical protein